MSQAPDVRERLKAILKREPTCSRLRDGSYMADFFKYGAPAKTFIGATEEQALEALLKYLESKSATPA